MADNIQFDGKEKTILYTDNPEQVIIRFKDVTTAFGGIKRARLKDKGICCNTVSSILFKTLEDAGVPTHFISKVSDREQLCRMVGLIPLQIIVRNRLAGTTAELLGVDVGKRILNPVYEIRLNDDNLHDPMINRTHAAVLGIVTEDEMDTMLRIARRVNEVLSAFLLKAGIELVDFKMECGRLADGTIILSDELSPDNTRLWDITDGRCLDKDRFRRDMSDVTATYKEVMDRLLKIASI